MFCQLIADIIVRDWKDSLEPVCIVSPGEFVCPDDEPNVKKFYGAIKQQCLKEQLKQEHFKEATAVIVELHELFLDVIVVGTEETAAVWVRLELRPRCYGYEVYVVCRCTRPAKEAKQIFNLSSRFFGSIAPLGKDMRYTVATYTTDSTEELIIDEPTDENPSYPNIHHQQWPLDVVIFDSKQDAAIYMENEYKLTPTFSVLYWSGNVLYRRLSI